GRGTFVVAHPPPNVTGALHTGHALQISLADLLIRWHRMRGFETAFLTGYDHAGISTQNAVEKHLVTQGTSREEVGRERFVEIVWEWLREYGGTIMGQFRRMGASMDYRRERFTMDGAYVRAVMRFFVHLYGKGGIYRANRIINWCPHHETALSDLELVHEEVDDALTYVRYPFADDPEGGVTIATARPATILADVAVAVNPDEERWRDAVGREVVVPFVERTVPVIADERVDPEFGTGALKVTPGHDAFDTTPNRNTGSRSTRSRTPPTGTSPGSSGGATSCRSGSAPTGTSRSRKRSPRRAPSAAPPSSCAARTSSTRGSRRRCGRSRS